MWWRILTILRASCSNATKPTLNATNKSSNKEYLAKYKDNKAPPHTSTHDQKANLLEGVAKCILKGLATDNGNLNIIGWSLLMVRIISQLQLSLSQNQIKNTKNKIQDVYV
ncbi:hypothetical protein VP01_1144g5 [Puccinia sorghi]|uniref:Uncharacterized protein n=1 Tax=Puccinia sorghi TaxID=27349 RepID=A0A0L6VTA0_9BASI|nr:hypothetical protein VP01_1144g5 [Puccinia sorghi]